MRTDHIMDLLYNVENTRYFIQRCSDCDHTQQVAYSTYYDSLTQICFSCGVVRTQIKESEVTNI